MNQKQINEVKQISPVIWKITMNNKYDYAMFDDEDSQVDYFHAVSLPTKHIIESYKEEFAYRVILEPVNNEDLPKYDKRAARYAKALNYDMKKIVEQRHSEMDGVRHEWTHVEYVLSDKGVRAK
jgi:hypothetical protein